jgi:translation initiation factor IF-3
MRTKFLEAGEKVRAYVHFKGRAIVYKEQGEILLLRFAQALRRSRQGRATTKAGRKADVFNRGPKSTKKK